MFGILLVSIRKNIFWFPGFSSHCRKFSPCTWRLKVQTLSTVPYEAQINRSMFYRIILFRSNCLLKCVLTQWVLCLVLVKRAVSYVSVRHTFTGRSRPRHTFTGLARPLFTFMWLARSRVHFHLLPPYYFHSFTFLCLNHSDIGNPCFKARIYIPPLTHTFQSCLLLLMQGILPPHLLAWLSFYLSPAPLQSLRHITQGTSGILTE